MPTTEKHLEAKDIPARVRAIAQLVADNGSRTYAWDLRDAANLIEAQAASLREAQERVAGLEKVLKAIHEQLDCPARNTNRGRTYREAVTISEDLRQQVRAALPQAAPAQRREEV